MEVAAKVGVVEEGAEEEAAKMVVKERELVEISRVTQRKVLGKASGEQERLCSRALGERGAAAVVRGRVWEGAREGGCGTSTGLGGDGWGGEGLGGPGDGGLGGAGDGGLGGPGDGGLGGAGDGGLSCCLFGTGGGGLGDLTGGEGECCAGSAECEQRREVGRRFGLMSQNEEATCQRRALNSVETLGGGLTVDQVALHPIVS